MNLERRFLAGKRFLLIVLREGNDNILALARGQTDDLLLKAGDECTGAERQLILLRLAAVKRLAVYEAFKIKHDRVAQFCGTLHRLNRCDVLCLAVQLCLDLLLRNGSFCLGDFQTLVLAKLYLGIQRGLDHDGNGVCRHIHVGNARLTDCLDALIQNGLFINLREDFLNAVLVEDLGAVHFFNHLSRCLTLTEAGNADRLADLTICLVDAALQQAALKLDGNLGVVIFFFNALYIHDTFPPMRYAAVRQF